MPRISTSGQQRKYSITSIEFSVICLPWQRKGFGIFGHWKFLKIYLIWLVGFIRTHSHTHKPVGKCRKLIFLLQFYSSAKFNNKLWHFWPLEQATTVRVASGMQPTMRHGQKLPGLHWGALKPEIYVHACIRAGFPVGPVCLPHCRPSLLPSSAVRASCQRHRPLGCGCACGFSYGSVSFICTADNIHEMLKIHCDIYVCMCVTWNYISYAFTVRFVWFAFVSFGDSTRIVAHNISVQQLLMKIFIN